MDKCISSFVETIKFYIAENNLTPTSFAKRLGVKDVCVARWLSGINIPSIKYVVMVADFMGCSVNYLLGVSDQVDFVPSENKACFAERFSFLNRGANISLNQLAKLCGVTSSNVSKWLIHGQLPKYHVVVLLADYFNCSVDYLLGRSNNM